MNRSGVYFPAFRCPCVTRTAEGRRGLVVEMERQCRPQTLLLAMRV